MPDVPAILAAPHPLADIGAFVSTWPVALAELEVPAWLHEPAAAGAAEGLRWGDDVKAAVRDLLRAGGFKPAGRNKPCNEYIRVVTGRGDFPRINAAVDACNRAVLLGGLPISTVDVDRLKEPLSWSIADRGARVVFNRSGQEIDLSGLLCLFDAEGPCANAVKDSQRAKTNGATTRTLSVVWGTTALPGRTAAVMALYERIVQRVGATTARLDHTAT